MANYVASDSYPHVAKISDPLLVRLDALSLQVGDSVYHAKIKYGNAFKGYNIYVSGTNMPIVEINIDETVLNKRTAEECHLSSTSIKTSESQRKNVIKYVYAKVWLDELEEAIANAKGSSEIKQAIDRLNWQMHYDTTESGTNLPEALENFSDVDIDTSGGTHIPTMARDLNTKIQDVGDQITGSSSGSGGKSLSDLADGMSDINSSIGNVNTTIGNVNTTLGNVNTTLGTMDSNMNNGTTGTLVKLRRSISDDSINENSIYKALRGSSSGNGYSRYSVVTALREDDDTYSVSGATYEQTELERTEFEDVDTRLGQPGTGNSIWGTVYNMNGNSATQSTTLWTHASTVDSNVGTVPSGGKTVVERLGNPGGSDDIWGTVNTINGNVGSRGNNGSVLDRIGTPDKSGTVWYDVLNNAGGVGTISGIQSTVNAINGTVNVINSNIGDFASNNEYTGKSLRAVIGENSSTHSGYTVIGQLNDLHDNI